MPKRLRKPEELDAAQSAFAALGRVIAITEGKAGKNPAAVELGRKGGLKSAAARMKKISPSKRRRIAKAAAAARWGKKR